jgi:glutamate synthase domain-containing protein 3
MSIIDADNLYFQDLNDQVRKTSGDILIKNCLGQRYIAAGRSEGVVDIEGTPGNALGAYLDGCTVITHANAQDAVGDTMNEGSIIIHGNAGDAVGYAMRGGRILVKGNVGYRAGIHMKAYQEKVPKIVVGGCAGSFLGEYQAGGRIIVLNIEGNERIVGDYCGAGMHAGEIYLRCETPPEDLPRQVILREASEEDVRGIREDVEGFCRVFGFDIDEVMSGRFYVLRPNSANPYKQLYTNS